ncbi:MAG: hypothetical protein CBC13_00965 [Planctomycetia bacterium TMED53]|nr:MAG: hypothetical protein CBC13_00965 [Planctomycetia bacterium TMED53]
MNSTPEPKAYSLKERMNALERMRAVETKIIQSSLPLIQRLLSDLENLIDTTMPVKAVRELEKGELWWSDLDESYPDHDPRCFPVVRDAIEELALQLPADHFANQPRVQGQSYRDLVRPIRDQVQQRSKLRQIAGTR